MARARLARAARGTKALPALFAGSVVESSVFPWPIEFPMLAYMLRGRRETVLVTVVVALGSAIGCLLAYSAGRAAYGLALEFVAARPGLQAGVDLALVRIDRFGPIAVLLAMLTPVPVQISSFAAGLVQMSAPAFFLAALLGRLIRYGAMGVIVFFYGGRVVSAWRRLPRGARGSAVGAIWLVFLALCLWAVMSLAPPPA